MLVQVDKDISPSHLKHLNQLLISVLQATCFLLFHAPKPIFSDVLCHHCKIITNIQVPGVAFFLYAVQSSQKYNLSHYSTYRSPNCMSWVPLQIGGQGISSVNISLVLFLSCTPCTFFLLCDLLFRNGSNSHGGLLDFVYYCGSWASGWFLVCRSYTWWMSSSSFSVISL